MSPFTSSDHKLYSAKIFATYLFFQIAILQHIAAQNQSIFAVYFAFNGYELSTIARHILDTATENRDIIDIDLVGNCDSVSGNPYNDALSKKRADAVKEYFTSKQIDANLISIQAMGKRAPINKNLTERDRALNRRVDVKIRYKNKSSNEITASTSEDTVTLNINEVPLGGTLVFENINFYGGRHVLLPGSMQILTILLRTMRNNPALEIDIQGHICCKEGDVDGYDMDTGDEKLSLNRAKAIYDYLLNNGITKSRISYSGFGASRKLVKEITENDRMKNRRVEIKILKR